MITGKWAALHMSEKKLRKRLITEKSLHKIENLQVTLSTNSKCTNKERLITEKSSHKIENLQVTLSTNSKCTNRERLIQYKNL